MPWKELAKIALLGTENSSFSSGTLQKLQEQGFDVKKEAPLLLAEASAMFAQMRKAGFPLKDFEGKLPEAAEFVEETNCSYKSTRHLKLILDGKYALVFPEFLYHLLENGKRLPTELMPALMQRPDIDEWWELIEMAISQGGRWLIGQHPDWKMRLNEPENRNWETESKIHRIAFLKFLRKNNPAQAIELLRSTWDTENYRNKTIFLQELKVGLSAEDEGFLENALHDRRKEVRQVAAELLSQLPLSEYAERMFQRALDCLFYEKGKWHITIPDEPDKVASTDGILIIHPEWKGEKAGYLGQIFSGIPPSRWELHFELEPEPLLKLFAKNEWSNTLHKAIAIAAVFHHDEKWIGQMFTYWFENENSPLWNDPVGIQVLELAPPEIVNQLSIAYLKERKGLPEEDDPVFQVLQQNDAPWQNELTLLIINRLQEWLTKYKGQPWLFTYYKKLLQMTGCRCDPSLSATLQKGWDISAPIWYDWEKEVEEMLNTVFFRKEMIEELNL